jgi:hypothetical protein
VADAVGVAVGDAEGDSLGAAVPVGDAVGLGLCDPLAAGSASPPLSSHRTPRSRATTTASTSRRRSQ